MAATIIINTIERAQREVSGTAKRQVVTGQIKDLDVTGGADGSVLTDAEQLLHADPRIGDMGTAHPYDPDLKLARLMLYSIPAMSNRLRFELYYETPEFGVTSSYIIRDGSAMTSYQTRFLPGAPNRRVRLVTNDITYTDESGISRTVKANSVDMTLLRPVRTIQVTAVIYGQPPTGIQDAMGKVNNATWKGKPTGYWMVMGIESDVSKYAGYYTYSASVMTKGNEDWSDIAILIDPLTGLPVKTDDTAVQTALGTDYTYGNHPGAGFTRVCPYETANFADLFGFN